MNKLTSGFDSLDKTLAAHMARYGITLLRLSVGVIFLWFGFLKFFPGLSSAEDLATRTMQALSVGLVPTRAALTMLAVWECVIGLGLLLGICLRATLLLLWLQMAGTVTPAIIFPQEVFSQFPFVPTFEGQYIIKNLVLISAGIVVGATVRGGRLKS